MICLILFVIGLIGILICCFIETKSSVRNGFIVATAIICLIGIFSSLFVSEKPKEFPASEYVLEYRIDVHPSYSDTTYVLVPVE